MNSNGNIMMFVQGEGRGHMTQAITLYNLLKDQGHHVSEVLIGKSPERQLPDFVTQKLKCSVTQFESPNFVTDSKMKGIRIFPTILESIRKSPLFKKSIEVIHEKIKAHRPDMIINFFDPLLGFYYLMYKPRIPLVCIAHQYLYMHPGFEFPSGHFIDKSSIKLYTQLTCAGAVKKIALSFYPINNYQSRSIISTAPLLRKEVKAMEHANENFLLVYLLNSGYMDDIIRWHDDNSTIPIHCFTDKKGLLADDKHDDTLTFHQLNDVKFLDMMSRCKGVVTTAGFESVCEAMYLGKPTLMVPVQGHYEQFCNARDAHKAGAGIFDDHFNISRFLEYIPSYTNDRELFRQWVDRSEMQVIHEINSSFKRKSPLYSLAVN